MTRTSKQFKQLLRVSDDTSAHASSSLAAAAAASAIFQTSLSPNKTLTLDDSTKAQIRSSVNVIERGVSVNASELGPFQKQRKNRIYFHC